MHNFNHCLLLVVKLTGGEILLLPVGKVGNYSSLQNSLFLNSLITPCGMGCEIHSLRVPKNIISIFILPLWRKFHVSFIPPYFRASTATKFGNRYTSWREIDKELLSRQRGFFPSFTLKTLDRLPLII